MSTPARFELYLLVPGKEKPVEERPTVERVFKRDVPPTLFTLVADHEGDRALIGSCVPGRDGFTLADPKLEATHAAFSFDGETFHVEPTGAAKIEVRGADVSERTTLQAGDDMQLGWTVFRVEVSDAASPPLLQIYAEPVNIEFNVLGDANAGHRAAAGEVPDVPGDHDLKIGAGGQCQLRLRDPLLAPEHARIVCSNGRFEVRAADTVTGTWLNGARLPAAEEGKPGARLENDDRLLVGYSLLGVTIENEGEDWARLSLKHKRRAFALQPQPRDEEDWPLGELKMGRSSALRRFNLVALGLGFLLLVLSLVSPGFDERLVDPGPLNRHHAALFERDPATLPAVTPAQIRYRDMVVAAQAAGCGACHEAGERPSMASCRECHADLMANQHPRRDEPLLELDEARVDRPYEADDCLLCHVDHRGPVSVRGSFRPTVEQTQEKCTFCHETWPNDTPPEPRVTKAELTEVRSVWSAYDAFPHREHLNVAADRGGAIACALCHVPARGKAPAAVAAGVDERWRRDFAAVTYETCLECHSPPTREVGSDYEPWHREMPADLRFDLAWHGTADVAAEDDGLTDCLTCHERVEGVARPALPWRFDAARQVWAVSAEPWVKGDLALAKRRKVDAVKFDVQRRSHKAEFLLNLPDEMSCGKCHRDGPPQPTREDRTFWHALHMRSITPADASAARELSRKCLDCHRRLGDDGDLRATLARPFYDGPPREKCGECHLEDGFVGEAKVVAPEETAWTFSPDFPHHRHMDWSKPELVEGCLSCHSFEAAEGRGWPFELVATTDADAASCARCHVASEDSRWAGEPHANVAGGNCFPCHRREDASLHGRTVPRAWPALNGFDHYSAGHRESTEESCLFCHETAEASLAEATSIAAVPIPDESFDVCRKCHVETRSRFHWR